MGLNDRIPYLLYTSTCEILTLLFNSTLKRYLSQKEPPHMDHYREGPHTWGRHKKNPSTEHHFEITLFPLKLVPLLLIVSVMYILIVSFLMFPSGLETYRKCYSLFCSKGVFKTHLSFEICYSYILLCLLSMLQFLLAPVSYKSGRNYHAHNYAFI